MLADDFTNFVRTQPFRPYRILLDDGRFHEIEHPDMALIVGVASIIIGVPPKGLKKGGSTDEVLVSLSHVTQIEFIDPQ
jgi:hypothetical protein